LKKILLVGNHTCGNRGDAAILRGLISEIKTQQPDCAITVLSRFPQSSTFLLNHPVEPDKLHNYRKRAAGGLIKKLYKFAANKLLSKILYLRAKNAVLRTWLPMPAVFKQELLRIEQFDLVVQVGGSFFVDVYGSAQYDYALLTLQSVTPYYIFGHSVGPFRNKESKKLSQLVFNRCNALVLREAYSQQRLVQDGVTVADVIMATDTAWLVESEKSLISADKQQIIAVTFRELTPFDRILGINQQDYENAFTYLIDELHNLGYQVKAFSTCTGIDGYPKDDRMVALRIKDSCKQPDKMHVVMDELNDIELGEALSLCILTIGTRLHSAIISMNFGTPAFALNYEHKSAGIMANLDLPNLAQPLTALIDRSIFQHVMHALNDIDQLTMAVNKAVVAEKTKAKNAISLMFNGKS
tara:strand:+ start:3622 stop:4857 length:1236 start_codon:yes stop_codon:yes gene_type:complete